MANRTFPLTTSFTTDIPFNEPVTALGETEVSGALTFTVDGTNAQVGYGAILRLVANGVNTPDFSAFSIVSGTWDNTDGVVNQLTFYFDGGQFCLGIKQPPAGGEVGDITPPTVVSRVIENATPDEIHINYNEALDTGSVPANGDFTFNVGTISSVGVSGSRVTITFAAPFGEGQIVTGGYTPGTNPVQDVAGNEAVAWGPGTGITNNITSLIQLSTPGSFTATVVSSTAIDLDWNDVANESGYEVERSPNGTTGWTNIASPAAGVLSHSDTGLTPSTQYFYRVKAVGDGITYSDSAWATDDATTSAGGTDYLGLTGTPAITWLSAHFPEDAVLRTATNYIEEIEDRMYPGAANPKLVQATLARQPEYQATGIGGRPGILISGTTGLLTTAFGNTASKPHTTLFAVKFTAIPANVRYVLLSSGNQHDWGHWNNLKPFMYSSTQLLGPSDLVVGTIYVVCCVYYGDATPDEMYINDGVTPVVTGDAGGTTGNLPSVVGVGDWGGTGIGAAAVVGPIFTYEGALSSGDRQGAINQYKTELGI